MNERRRRPANVPVNSQQSSHYIVAIALVFCAFLAWLWLYSPGGYTGDSHTPSLAIAEVREWLNSNGLRPLEKDPKIVGKGRKNYERIVDYRELGYFSSIHPHGGVLISLEGDPWQQWVSSRAQHSVPT